MQFTSIILYFLAYSFPTPAGASFVQPSDVVPYYSHPGQGSHSRLGANNYQVGLLYQKSPIQIRLTGDTVVLRQEANFDILNEKMSTLNKFRDSVTCKIKDLHNTSITSLLPLNPIYHIQPQVNLLRSQLNKSLHNSHSNLMFKHSRFCLKQQEIMQKILQTQQYEQTFVTTTLHPSYMERHKRALPFLLAKLIAGISTIATSKIFTFLQSVTAFASFSQLLEHAHNTYGTLPHSYESTPQLKQLFEATNLYQRQPRFAAQRKDFDIALGHYTNKLSSLFNNQNLSGINELDSRPNPDLALTSFTRADRRHSSLANLYEHSRAKNSQYARHASKYIMDVANHHLTIISGLFHAETVTRDILLEVQEIDHLTEII